MPTPPDLGSAPRVLLGVLVPGAVLMATDRPEYLLYAVLGSFVGMYGRDLARRRRLRHQFHGAGMVLTGATLGAVLAGAHLEGELLVLVVTAFAASASLACDVLDLRPAGPFFGILALGAAATVAPEAAATLPAVLVVAVTAAWCLALGAFAPGGAEEEDVEDGLSLPEGAVAQATRYALATLVAGTIGMFAGLDHANWAMTAAAVPLAVVRVGAPLDLRAVTHRAWHRIAGTAAGLLLTGAVLALEPSATWLAITVIVLLFPTELFLTRHHGIALGFFTPLVVLMTDLAEPSSAVSLLVARGVDTLVGVASGVLAAAVVSPRLAAVGRRRTWAV